MIWAKPTFFNFKKSSTPQKKIRNRPFSRSPDPSLKSPGLSSFSPRSTKSTGGDRNTFILNGRLVSFRIVRLTSNWVEAAMSIVHAIRIRVVMSCPILSLAKPKILWQSGPKWSTRGLVKIIRNCQNCRRGWTIWAHPRFFHCCACTPPPFYLTKG